MPIRNAIKTLLETVNTLHSAYPQKEFTLDGRMVQIKATMKDALTFPVDHVPDYYLGIKINSDGSFTEIFNGPGKIAAEAIKNRKPTKTNLHSVTLSALNKLNEKVPSAEKIKRKR